MTSHERLGVALGARSYDILVGDDLIAEAGRHIAPLLRQDRVFVVTDANVAELHLARLERALDEANLAYEAVVLPPGEQTKDFEHLESLVERLLEMKIERGSTLIAFGGFASYPAGQLNRKQSFVVTAAGPALQLLLGILIGLGRLFVEIPPASLLNNFTYYLVLVSIFWAVLNCLPIYPMDGGQMLAAILGPNRQRYVYLTGAVCAAIIGVVAYTQLTGIILPLFMGYFAWKNWQTFKQQIS